MKRIIIIFSILIIVLISGCSNQKENNPLNNQNQVKENTLETQKKVTETPRTENNLQNKNEELPKKTENTNEELPKKTENTNEELPKKTENINKNISQKNNEDTKKLQTKTIENNKQNNNGEILDSNAKLTKKLEGLYRITEWDIKNSQDKNFIDLETKRLNEIKTLLEKVKKSNDSKFEEVYNDYNQMIDSFKR